LHNRFKKRILLSFFFVAASRNRTASNTQQGVFFTGNNLGMNIIVIISLRDRRTVY
jgi:hypothetical protein